MAVIEFYFAVVYQFIHAFSL